MINSNLINILDKTIREYRPEIYPYYNNPLPDTTLDYYLSQLEINSHDFLDLKVIYQWKNGISIDNWNKDEDARLIFYGNFMRLEDIVEEWVSNKDDEYGWTPNTLVPIICNYEGEYILIETDKRSTNFQHLFFYSPNLFYATEPITSYDSLSSMLETIIELYKKKAQV